MDSALSGEALPLIKFEGKIHYCNTFIDCAVICDYLLQTVNSSTKTSLIGFDIEWPCMFKKNACSKTALIQLCACDEACYLLHVSQCKNLPVSLTELLSHKAVRLLGVNIKSDVKKLAKDFTGLNLEIILNNCIDVGNEANLLVKVPQRWSMEALVEKFLAMKIDKSPKIRKGKWDIIPLTKKQMDYAATDAYVSLKLFIRLKFLQSAERELAALENAKKGVK